ncbi:hypothetical protein ACFLSF_03710 [Candidatus Bipolaricaulota bacterium]
MRDHNRSWLTAKDPVRLLKAGLIVAVLVAAALTQACTSPGGVPGGAAGGGIPGGSTGGVVSTAGPMVAEGRVVSAPQGGMDVMDLSVAFEMIEVPGTGTAPVAIQVSWVAPCGTHKTEGFLFAGGTQTFYSTYSGGGYPITMTFRAIITWEDADGTHRIQSDAAVCL